MTCGRYAPSPSGRLHLGNLRTALAAWLHARLTGGKFILRIDDIDVPRNKPGSLESIIDDLRWIGLDWDEGPDVGGPNEPYLQSQRQDFYLKAFTALQDSMQVYPCYCSRKDIAQSLSAPHIGQAQIVYPGTCRPGRSTNGERSLPGNRSEECAWRFLVGATSIRFDDNILGNQQQRLETDVGDFVVRRRDGLYAYQLASIVDDSHMAITDVVRGADLVDSTPRQIALMQALQCPFPEFWHIPLMLDQEGRRMSKRDGSYSLEQWRDHDRFPAELVGVLSHSLGLIDSNQRLTCAELLAHLDLNQFRSCLKNTPGNPDSG